MQLWWKVQNTTGWKKNVQYIRATECASCPRDIRKRGPRPTTEIQEKNTRGSRSPDSFQSNARVEKHPINALARKAGAIGLSVSVIYVIRIANIEGDTRTIRRPSHPGMVSLLFRRYCLHARVVLMVLSADVHAAPLPETLVCVPLIIATRIHCIVLIFFVIGQM